MQDILDVGDQERTHDECHSEVSLRVEVTFAIGWRCGLHELGAMLRGFSQEITIQVELWVCAYLVRD